MNSDKGAIYFPTAPNTLLSWTHYRVLLQVKDSEARALYEKEAAEQTWSVRTLQRNISSQYYYCMLQTQKKELVESEMKELTAPYQNDKYLPTEEELREEIETQKTMFYLQQQESESATNLDFF